MIPEKADVVVIGGGPSGAMASALLAQSGINVVLLEKEHFPRYAVGESLIPHFWKFTDLIGASEAIENAGFIKKGGGSTYWNGSLKVLSFAPFGHDRPGLHVERDEFDNILLSRSKELGTQVFEGVQVKSVKISDEENSVFYSHNGEDSAQIKCRFLIDASGQSAVVAKQMGIREFDPEFRFQAFWGYFDQSDYLDRNGIVTSFDNRFTTNPTSLVTGTGDWGWSWHLMMKEKVSVGAMIPKVLLPEFKSGGNDLKSRFLQHVSAIPITAGLLSDSNLISEVKTTRDYAYSPSKLAFKGCFLTGDAVAFADPINSEGVTMALYGGMMAAWAIQKSLENMARVDFYKNMYINTLERRFKVFQLLSYPKDKIAPHLLQSCIEVIKGQSEDETNLILAHLVLTNRANDFPELMEAMNINKKIGWKEIPLNENITSHSKYAL